MEDISQDAGCYNSGDFKQLKSFGENSNVLVDRTRRQLFNCTNDEKHDEVFNCFGQFLGIYIGNKNKPSQFEINIYIIKF